MSSPRPFLWPVRLPERGHPDAGRRPLPERLRFARPRISTAVVALTVINLLLIAAYLWSRGGQATHVTIQAKGNEFVARIDGREFARARLPAADQGGIIVMFGHTGSVPSLPEPRGIDSIRVRDLATGETLFKDDFSSGPSPDWRVGGRPVVVDGVVGARSDLTLSLADRNWGDYTVEATFRNFQAGAIMVRARSLSQGVSYGFRPFRDFDNGFTLQGDGQRAPGILGGHVELSPVETVKSLLAMVLRPYPYIVLLLAGAFIVVLGLQLTARLGLPATISELSDSAGLALAAGFAIFGFVLTLFLNYSYSSHMPHVPDELSYLFQAKLLAAARLTAPLPPVRDAFDYFYPPFIVATRGHWAGVYPFGHPLLLALGVKIGAVWLIPPVIGALSVLLTFAIGRKVYSARVGALAALLYVASPFYLMTASNFMSHNTAAFYLLCSLACIAYAERRPLLFGALGGISFGLLFNTQALTAVSLVVPIGLLLAAGLVSAERRLAGQRLLAGFVWGGLLLLGAYFLYNYGTTGHATTSLLSQTSGSLVGFGGENSVSLGIQNQQVQLAFLLLVLHGWPLFIGLMIALLPFLFGTRQRWDWFLLAAAVSGMGIYVLFIGSGVMHGPRYWYVISPLLLLLTARGAECAGNALTYLASRARSVIAPAQQAAPAWAGIVVVYLFITALAGTSAYNWLLGRNTTWADLFVPARAADLRGFNSTDDRLVKLVDDAHLHNALVLVQAQCEGWQCYGNLFWRNNTTLDGDVVYARDLPDRRAELFAAYPDRFVYYAQYSPPAYLSVYGSTAPLARATAKPPRAHDIALPTPAPTATPDVAQASERDDQRRQDLDALATALGEYHVRHGTFPPADGIQSFCRYPELDAGCAVREVLDPLPRDPSEARAYYYTSNGQVFYLFADMETPAGPSRCEGAPIRPEIPAERLYCAQGAPAAGGG